MGAFEQSRFKPDRSLDAFQRILRLAAIAFEMASANVVVTEQLHRNLHFRIFPDLQLAWHADEWQPANIKNLRIA
jgi:hypothetical protein